MILVLNVIFGCSLIVFLVKWIVLLCRWWCFICFRIRLLLCWRLRCRWGIRCDLVVMVCIRFLFILIELIELICRCGKFGISFRMCIIRLFNFGWVGRLVFYDVRLILVSIILLYFLLISCLIWLMIMFVGIDCELLWL